MFLNEFRTISKTVLAVPAPLIPRETNNYIQIHVYMQVPKLVFIQMKLVT